MIPFPNPQCAGGQGFGYALDPTAASAAVALSNANRTATGVGTGVAWKGARSLNGRSSGKIYLEASWISGPPSEVGFGIVGSGDLMNGFWPATNNAHIRNDGSIYANGTHPATVAAWSPGFACCAVDFDANLIWFRSGAAGNWNNSGTANPATGVGGFSLGAPTYPAYAAVLLQDNTCAITINLGSAAFLGTPPSGFTSP